MIPCLALDDFLANDLSGDDRSRFVGHLPHCPACRQTVEEYERLTTLLTVAVAIGAVPAGLTDRVRRRIRAARRRRLTIAVGALAAAVAVLVWMRARPPVQWHSAPPEPVAARPVEPVRVTFPTGDVLAVRKAMSSPNVTFVWVYNRLPANEPAAVERSEP
jgi:anti-sigma factor RsiW